MGKLDDLRKAVSAIAPTLGMALGGPLGGIAGGFVAKAVGKPLETDPSAMAEAITTSSDPSIVLQLKQAEDDFQEFVKTNDLNLKALDVQDRSGARTMQISMKSAMPGIMAGFVTLGFFALLLILTRRDVPAGSKEVLDTMVGVLGTAWVAIVNFYFGSSAGSALKDDALTEHLKSTTSAK